MADRARFAPMLRSREGAALLGIILFQAFCTVFFVTDVIGDMEVVGWETLTDPHILPELFATLGLITGIAILSLNLIRLLRRQAQIERSLSVAQGALAEVMDGYFQGWGLTASEQDIATFTIKGYSIAEIAELRGSAEATVKTHLNAIYRKSGTTGRGQLTSLLVEDLLRNPLIEPSPAPAEMARPRDRAGQSSAERLN